MEKLYEITQAYAGVTEALNALNPEDAGDTHELESLLNEINDKFDEKAKSIANIVRRNETNIKNIDDEIERLKKLKKQKESTVDFLNSYLLASMKHSGIEKVDAGLFTIKINNTPPSVDIAPGTKLDEEYLTIPEVVQPEPKPNKRLIGEHLKAGVIIEGCKLVSKQVLKIK